MSVTDIESLQELMDLCAKNSKVLVDFYATWCGPCKAIAPYLVKQCTEKGVTLAKVDVDKAGDAAQKYEVQAMPTFKVLDSKGDVVAEKVGGGQANVNAIIAKALE